MPWSDSRIGSTLMLQLPIGSRCRAAGQKNEDAVVVMLPGMMPRRMIPIGIIPTRMIEIGVIS